MLLQTLRNTITLLSIVCCIELAASQPLPREKPVAGPTLDILRRPI